ncbi:MAG: DUF3307 domain-containing protein [Streptosporangiales bacterium]|nr:DUF3307 domain-containing protein [Streptosporangiales bacterium]
MMHATEFTVVFIALFAGHQVGDFWIQRDTDARNKGLPGWKGRRACAIHVATYTLTQAYALVIAATVLAVPLDWQHVAPGLAVSAVTHYAADRRALPGWLAGKLGKARYWATGEGQLALDQAWHYGSIFAAALVIAGRWSW